jgi:hypothetical protein
MGVAMLDRRSVEGGARCSASQANGPLVVYIQVWSDHLSVPIPHTPAYL